MNYRHTYHAGNFADVFKHIVLVGLIECLLRKDTPFCYVDTHAGIGRYDLQDSTTQKSHEYIDGIQKIFSLTEPMIPPLIQAYLAKVMQLNPSGQLRYYPGSPYFVQSLLRAHDRMILSELHPDDVRTLKQVLATDRRIAIHHQDGYQSLKAFLPPKERRGLVLIDPPYEQTNEFALLADKLILALKRWETGIYAIWYPIKYRIQVEHFYRQLQAQLQRPWLLSELCPYPEVVGQLHGCGMIIINPPWQFDQQLLATLPWLQKKLAMSPHGHYRLNDFSPK